VSGGGGRAERGGPAPWRELSEPLVRVRGDAQQDVLQVAEGRDADEGAALDEGVEQRRPLGALEAAGEEPVLATDRDDAELILGPVVVDGQAPIVDVALQGLPLIGEIPHGVAHARL